MKTESIYRKPISMNLFPAGALHFQIAFTAGVSRARRDAALAEARGCQYPNMRRTYVHIAKSEQRMYLSGLAMVRREIERLRTQPATPAAAPSAWWDDLDRRVSALEDVTALPPARPRPVPVLAPGEVPF